MPELLARVVIGMSGQAEVRLAQAIDKARPSAPFAAQAQDGELSSGEDKRRRRIVDGRGFGDDRI